MMAATLINITTQRFANEADMQLRDLRFAKHSGTYLPRLKKAGLIKWTVVRVWNTETKTTYKHIFEYENTESFHNCAPIWKEMSEIVFAGIDVKISADRGIVAEEYIL